MNSLEYWRERETAQARAYALSDDDIRRRIEFIFARLVDDVQTQIDAFYAKYAGAQGITIADAMQRVANFDVKAFEATAAKMVADRDFSPEANTQLRLYNLTMKVNRLEMLKAQIGLELIDRYGEVENLLSEEFYKRAMTEYERQAGILGFSLSDVTGNVDNIVNASFYNATWHNRIWASQSELSDAVGALLTNGMIQGQNPRVLGRRLAEAFGIDPSTGKRSRGAAYDAVRLMRNEMARIQTDVQMNSLQTAGYDEYVFIATEDAKTCVVCGHLDGQHFPIDKGEIAYNLPPMHPNCRCSTAAWVDREKVEQSLYPIMRPRYGY